MNNLIKFIVKNSGIHYDEITAERNQTLFFEGDECKKVGIIISGKINIISYFSDGKEVVYSELTKNQMFGNNLIFSSEPFYRGDVVAMEKSVIYYVSREELMKALSASPEFLELYLKQQSDFSKTLNFKIKLMTIGNARDRFLYYLTFYNKQITYKSVTKLAKELYLTRESLSRTMYKMAKDGEIKIENKTITLK